MAFIDVKHAINICFLHSSEVLLGSREKYCGIFGHVCRQLRALLNSFNFFLFAIYISAAVCLRQPMQGKARDWWGNKKEFNVGKLYEILDLGSPGRHPVPLLSFYCNESQSCTKRRKGAESRFIWWFGARAGHCFLAVAVKSIHFPIINCKSQKMSLQL